MNAIELKNVNFSYDGKTQILGNVNLTLSYGEVNLIAGHSGEGKSTLLYIISGIIPNITDGKLSGEVLINGEDIKGKRLGEVCRLSVPENLAELSRLPELHADVVDASDMARYAEEAFS